LIFAFKYWHHTVHRFHFRLLRYFVLSLLMTSLFTAVGLMLDLHLYGLRWSVN